MNCRKCGQPLNGETRCSNCGTSIGYVVNNPDGFVLGNSNNVSNGYVQSNSNGYVQNNNHSGYVQNNNGYVTNNSPMMSSGWGVSEPTDGAFNKAYNNENVENTNEEKKSFLDVLKKNKDEKSIEKETGSQLVKKTAHKTPRRGFGPLNKFDDPYDTDNVIGASNTNSNNSEANTGLARAGTASKDMILAQINGNSNNQESVVPVQDSNNNIMTMEMEVPKNGKKPFNWFIAFAVIMVVILFGVYVLPLFTDIGYSRYEEEKFIIKYNTDWTNGVDESTKKVYFSYLDTEYKVYINSQTTFESLNFNIRNEEDKKTLYKAYYDVWKNVEGGKLTGGLGTFEDLEEDEAIYTKIDYKLDGDQGVGAFYVVICEKYDLILTFMTFCREADKEVFEKKAMELIEGIDYVGLTVEEMEKEEYATFKAGSAKAYKAGIYIDYLIPEAWVLDEERMNATKSLFNIFKFKDSMSVLEVKGYTGGYTYEWMKNSAMTTYKAIKEEKQITVNGKVWYVFITPDYTSGGYNYHNEIYFTMSSNNKYLYYMQVCIYDETNNDSVKKAYLDESIEYILESMTLHGVTG